MQLKKVLNNPWIIAVFAPIITTIISSILISKKQNVNIKESLLIMYSFIKSIFTYKIPLWGILLFILLIIFIIFIAISIFQKTKFRNSNEYPDWYYDFTTMNYGEWLFKWNYEVYGNKYEVENIRPICTCQCELVEKDRIGNTYYSTSVLFCPNCKKVYKYPDMETLNEVKSLISYNISKKDNA